jgi:hypothetical protein
MKNEENKQNNEDKNSFIETCFDVIIEIIDSIFENIMSFFIKIFD